ncbi:hypothetical protein [Sphingomonas sp. S2-65]|uniref:hypothetical protein n=1 Tax=Sphingomonas sp. S2-65 TaxID=2903960 RepID=UPI001F2465B2|nr:hypothetical protein [Sphingomonas sp. S2-65]UYY59420.1 hypothetical protein LZ586_04865 [Sphingomonas sp. S2-65]
MAIMAGDPPKAPVVEETSTICSPSVSRRAIQLRTFPSDEIRRVYPSPKKIVEQGGSGKIPGSFWRKAAKIICSPDLANADHSGADFIPKIVVFVDGEAGRDLLVMEYPNYVDAAFARARVNGRMVSVPAAIVWRLLDYSRGVWRG